ncbi:MAG: hypothetical protein IPG93_21085 [Burkholderiales bacterium]|nr:hypothetical protein [Burkholderiales bacterium]
MADRRVEVALVLLAGLAMSAAHGAPMSLADFRSDQARIGADFTSARANCARQAANAARVCAEEARAAHSLARAELDYRYSGKLEDQRHIVVVAANNAYSVARLKCGDQARGNREVCVQQARSDLSKALADPGRVWP